MMNGAAYSREALALAHDIGHPPFGHSGEEQLDRLMRPYGARFDHNLHALRIVETFENRYARFPGLNLTFEVREGIIKHSRELVPGQNPRLDEYLPGVRPPLEAQLIDLCDEIAYNGADLDDLRALLDRVDCGRRERGGLGTRDLYADGIGLTRMIEPLPALARAPEPRV